MATKISYKRLLLGFSLLSWPCYGQSPSESSSNIRLNVAQLPFGLLNVAYEKALGEHSSYKLDFVLSPWVSYLDRPAFFSLGFVEWRYYFNQTFKSYYLGAVMGGGIFRLQKWNYWADNKNYQVGWNSIFGLSMGYQQKINPKIDLDYFLNFGNSQGHYWGYRHDGSRYVDYNHSGEWIPINAGLQLVYKL